MSTDPHDPYGRHDVAALPTKNDKILAVIRAMHWSTEAGTLVRVAYRDISMQRKFVDAKIGGLAKPLNYTAPLQVILTTPNEPIGRLVHLDDVLSLEVLR
jgi:hypothetical protein